MATTISLDPRIIERIIRRTAASPALRFFCEQSQTNEDIKAVGQAAGVSREMWDEIAEAHLGGRRDMASLRFELKSLIRHFHERALDPQGAATPADVALSTCLLEVLNLS